MPHNTVCEHCGKPLNQGLTTRGRRRRFCSDACRAASSRDRKKREHAEQLVQARSQLSIDLRAASASPVGDVVAQLDTLADRIRSGNLALLECTSGDRRVLQASRNLLEAAGEMYWPSEAVERIQVLTQRVEGMKSRVERST